MSERKQFVLGKITELENQKATGGLISLQTHEQIDRDLSVFREELAGIEAAEAEQAEREKEIENKIEGDEITFNVSGVDFKQLPAELITLIDKVVRADRRRIYAEETEKFDKLIADHKETLRAADEREVQAVRQNDILQERISIITTDRDEALKRNGELVSEVSNLMIVNEDLQARFKNAADQLEESQREVIRLNSEIRDMRAAEHFGERKAQQLIDVTPEETSTMQDLVNSLAKKYVAVTPIGGNWHEAVAEDGSKEVVHTKDLPNIETQGSPFRGEDPSTQPDSNQLPVAEAAPVGNQFPTITPPQVGPIEVPGQPTDSKMEETATKGWVLQQIAELKKEIMGTGESAA